MAPVRLAGGGRHRRRGHVRAGLRLERDLDVCDALLRPVGLAPCVGEPLAGLPGRDPADLVALAAVVVDLDEAPADVRLKPKPDPPVLVHPERAVLLPPV